LTKSSATYFDQLIYVNFLLMILAIHVTSLLSSENKIAAVARHVLWIVRVRC